MPDTGERVVNRAVTAFCLDGYHVWHGERSDRDVTAFYLEGYRVWHREQSNKDVTAFCLDGYTHVTDT